MSIYEHYTMLRLGLGRWSCTRPPGGGAERDRRRAGAIRQAREERAWREAKLESSGPDD